MTYPTCLPSYQDGKSRSAGDDLIDVLEIAMRMMQAPQSCSNVESVMHKDKTWLCQVCRARTDYSVERS